MKQWMKRVSAILITIFTLGMYVPPALLPTNAEQDKEDITASSKINETLLTPDVHLLEEGIESIQTEDKSEADDYVLYAITEKAKEQMIQKLGPKIGSKVEETCLTHVFPQIEEVLAVTLAEVETDELMYFGITDQPTKGYGEKIFNLYDYRTKQDIARFDVRRDNRPLEGHWFNFHYHLSKDNFEQHHELGEIYWGKNDPPKWMT